MVKENEIKGKIAEAIVKCMFEELGFQVIPYGYEHTCPTIAKPDSLITGSSKNYIRKAPDFIIVDKNGEANFVEVKYRAAGVYRKETDYPYKDCYIILLTKEYIGIEQYKNLNDEATLNGENFDQSTRSKATIGSFKSLMDVPLFKNLDKDTILDYRKLLMKYMKG